jgi:hypothetical protein
MLRNAIAIIVALFTVSLYAQTSAKQIDNWSKLNQAQQEDATELLASVEITSRDVIDEFKIPAHMTYYSTDLNKKYQVKYSNNKTSSVTVGYVPLQFVESYEAELQNSYDDKGTLDTVPRLEVVLAIHYSESSYIPNAVNNSDTDNPSFGLPQLTLSTAKDLYRKNKDLYDNFFSIKNETVVFRSIESQIGLTINFLPDDKKYTRSSEAASIARYNGGGDAAKTYAAVILSRARLYGKMKSIGKDIESQTFATEYSKPAVKKVINTQLQLKGYEPLTDGEYKEAIDKAILVYEYSPSTSTDKVTVPTPDNGDIKKLPSQHVKFPPIPDDGCEYYIKMEKGRTLYSYFLNTQDLVHTMCDQKNEEFSIFYNTKVGKKALKSLYDIDQKNNNIQTNVKADDIIYIPADIVIKGDKETLQNMSKKCPQ